MNPMNHGSMTAGKMQGARAPWVASMAPGGFMGPVRRIAGAAGCRTKARSAGYARRPHGGFTVVELMVVIAIVAIATAVALPDMSSWLVNSRIQDAAANFQQNIQWARAYALKTDQEVDVSVTALGAGGCGWAMSLPMMGGTAVQGAPSMTALQFTQQYSGISCSVGATATTFPLTLMPNGTVFAPPSGGGPVVLADSSVLFAAVSDTAKFVTWLVKSYGAGELRSCIMAPLGAQNPVPTCVNQ